VWEVIALALVADYARITAHARVKQRATKLA
jgi:hypothetical protein